MCIALPSLQFMFVLWSVVIPGVFTPFDPQLFQFHRTAALAVNTTVQTPFPFLTACQLRVHHRE